MQNNTGRDNVCVHFVLFQQLTMFMHSHIQELVPMEIVNLMHAVNYKLPQILMFMEAKLSNHLVRIYFSPVFENCDYTITGHPSVTRRNS